MSQEVDEYASNVRKLQLMGFGNDSQIKEALSAGGNDIDSAITFLVNKNFEPSFKSQDTASDEKVGSQSLADDDFPVDKLRTLEESLYIEKWNIPCLRSQSLGLCLSSAIRIIKCRGMSAFVATEALQRFMTKCLTECLNKFLTSGAVLQWDAETLEGVHNMLELVIQLAIECLTVGKCFLSHEQQSFQKSDWQNLITLAFSYLESTFNPECSYHQRCRDRTTNTGIYADQFNHWSQVKDSGGERHMYAEILPAPKNFYLVNLLNCFGAHGGFDLILWYGTRPHLPLKTMQSVLGPLANVAEYLTLETMCRYSSWLMIRTLWLIHNLTSEDFNPQESRVFDLITSLRVLCYRSTALSNNTDSSDGSRPVVPFSLAELSHPRQPDWDALMERCSSLPPATSFFSVSHVDERHLAILLSSLCPPVGVSSSFKVRILATRHLIDQITAVQQARSSSALSKSGHVSAGATPVVTSTSILAAENQAFLRRRKLHRLIRYDALMSWVKEKAVVQSIMTNLDNVTYVATLCDLFRCLGDHITMEDISALWKCQETQSNAGINNILKLLSEVGSNGFNQAQFEHLLQLVRDSWSALDLQARLQFTRSSGSSKLGMKHRYRHRLSITTTTTPVRQPITESSTIRNARVRLLNFVATTAITSREVWVSDLCLQLLWQLSHGLHHKSPEHAKSTSMAGEEKGKATFGKLERLVSALSSSGGSGNGGASHNHLDGGGSVHHPGPLNPEHTEAAMAQLVIVLRECRLPTNEQRHRLNTWLSVAAEELKRGKSTYYVLDFLQTILDLICKPLPGRSKKDTLRELNKTYSLIDTVCNSLHRLQKQAATSKHLIASSSPTKSASSENNKTIRHSDLIKRHLDVLHYLLSTADLHLSVDRTQDIWDTLVNDYSLVLFNVEKTLLWFASALDLLETDAQNSLFTKNVLKLPPSVIQTLKGFQCFESFFIKVNLNEGRLKMNQDGWTVERMDLIGVDFLWDLYTSLPTTPTSAVHEAGHVPALHAEGKILLPAVGKGDLGNSSEVPLDVQIFNCRQAIHKARKLLLLISWSQLSSKLKRDPESCHKRFFDYCRKRIEINLAASTSNLSNISRTQSESRHLTVDRPLQPNLRSLLADTGQFLASLLVGPKAAASARSRLSKSSRLALYRLLYIVFSYIENAEDELIGAHEPPSCWKPHYMSFRGWELRIPLRVLNPSGQLLISSTLPLTARHHMTSFSLCLSDATADYLRNPILVVHSNATLASVRKLVALIIPVCLYALANTTTQFAFGSEVLSLDSIKPPGVSGLHELTNRNRQAPLSDPKSETPLGHKLDREAIGELGFQTGRTLVIRLRSHAEVQGFGGDINGASSFSISDGMHGSLLRRSSGLSMKSSGSGKLHPPPLPNVASSVSTSSFLPKVASFLHSEKQNTPLLTASANAGDPGCLQSPYMLPSLMLASSRSVYESVFELAENDLAENGTSQSKPNLLHMIRLLLYCLPTYHPPNGLHISERPGKATSKSVSNAFVASMVCTPENLIKAPQFRLLYLLQFLSGRLVSPESSAWWERAWDPSSAMASARVTEPQRVILPLESLQARTPTAHRLAPLETEEATSSSNIRTTIPPTTSAPVAASASAVLISSETCLHIPSTRSLTDANGSTSCPPSPEMVKEPKKRLVGGYHKATKWFIGGGSGGGKRKGSNSESSVTLSKTYEKSDWLEPLVIVLRKQLIEGTVKTTESGGSLLMANMFVRIVTPNEAATGSTSTAADASRSDAWISREIKHCALQILATLLNPSAFGSLENSGCDSRASSFSSSCSSLPTLMQPEFAPKLLSVLMDTALASATQTSDQQGGNFVPSGIGAAGNGGGRSGEGGVSADGCRSQRRRGLLPVVESHAGVANALDPLTSSTSFALTCQDVEIAVQSTRLMCQCVFTYSSQLMSAFLEIPDLKSSLIRLLLYSPSLRIRSETCYQLKQLLYDSAGQHHHSINPILGVEPCCHLLAWETSHSSQPPPYTFEPITLQHVRTSPYIDLLLDLFFKTPLDTAKGTSSKPLLPPFWTTQLNTLTDAEERQAIMHCGEFFRLRGRLFAMVEKSCLEHYAGQDHVNIFESEIQWFRSFAQVHPRASSWGDGLLPSLDCSLINGHLCFLRTACIQMVAMAIARATSVSRTVGAGCAAPSGRSAPLSTSASWEGGSGGGCRSSGGCMGLSPPPFLLAGGKKGKGNLASDFEATSAKKSHQNVLQSTICHPLPSNPVDSKLATLVTGCIRLMGNLVPTLLTDYMFPVANTMNEEYHSLPSGDPEIHRMHGNSLLQPPPKRLNGNARQEAFMLILFLARMDFQSLERTVNILVRLHHQSPPEEQLQTNHTPNSSMSLPTASNLGDSGGLTFEADVNIAPTASIMWDYRPSLLGRAACNFTGLRNAGATCYMNAVLQQLFMQPGVAEGILDVPTSKLDEKSLLYQTQELFLNLLFSQLQFYDPVGFLKTFRLWNTDTPIDPHEQQDAFDFFQSLIDQLDEGMTKFTDVPFFSKMFHGILSDTMYCEDCGHRYDREQSFSAINLTVCTADLLEAMRQYTREEVMEGDNAYFCERCQMKQRTLKRLTFSSLPPVLCLQLKRFGFDWERQVAVKSNQAFSFPRRLDMTPFMGDNAVQMPSGVSIQSNVSVDLGGKRNSLDVQPDASKRGFHLYDPEEEYADEEDRHGSALAPSTETGRNELAPHHHPHSHSESIEIAPPSYVYELSGIVIHSGQAHAGHYYSFIRDRGRMEQTHVFEQKRSQSISGAAGLPGFVNSQNPLRNFLRSDTLTQGTEDYSASADVNPPERWLKFNDTHIEEVEMTDEFLQQECFGGTYLAEVPGRPPEKRTRNYSAYLLFYQRVSSNVGAGVQPVETTRSRRTSDSSGKLRPVSTLNMRRNRHSSLSVEKSHFFSTFDEGRFYKPRFSVDEARGSRRSIPFSRLPFTGSSASTASATRQQRLSLALTSSLLRVSPLAGAQPSSTCLVGLTASVGSSGIGIGVRHESWNGETAPREASTSDSATAEQPTSNKATAGSPADEMLHRIRRRNLAFLRDQSIFSPDYANFVYNLAQGVLADTTALQFEPSRAVLGCQLVANFLFTTYLPLHASVKVSISPDLCKRLLGLCAPPPRNGRETHPHQTSASEQASLQEAGAKLDTHWMEMLLSLMTTNAQTISWSLGFLVRSPTRPMLNYMLACPKPLLRHQTARVVGVVLSTFYASKDASILDVSLNILVDYLLDLLPLEVPQYAQHCASYFGLLLGYVETCPHASVHLSNRSGTRRLLSFLVGEDADREETLSIDTGALSPPLSVPSQNVSFVVPSIVTPQKDAGFPTWASLLRNWTASQSKELGNYYLLLAHMLLQSNFDQFRNHPLPPAISHPSRLSLFPRPETARWLGFSSLATSSDALSQASANDLPTRLRYVGMFLLVEAVIRTYVENPHTPSPPQRQYEQQQPHLQQQSSVTGSVSSSKADTNQTPTHRNSLTGVSEEPSLRDTMIDVLIHLTQSWWIPSAAFISLLLSLIVTRPLVELRHYFDLTKQLLRVKDELQSARVLAVLCGLRGPAWHLRPNFQSIRTDSEAIFGGAATGDTDGCEGVCGPNDGQESSRYPPPPDFAHPGLLILLTGESGAESGSTFDSRRAYQCMKFLVELAAENNAVVEGLSHFPQLWGPAVEWLQSLLEASDAATAAANASFSRTAPLGRHTEHLDSTSPATTAAGRFRSGTFSGTTTSGLAKILSDMEYVLDETGKPMKKSGSIEDDSWALKRTSSAQTTLTEAARMLATMPGYDTQRLQTHREVDQDSPEHASPFTPSTA